MPEIRADRRKVRYEPDPQTLEAAALLCRSLHEQQLALAPLLERIHQKAAFLGEQCASIGEFTLHHGLPAKQGQSLRLVGRAMAAFDWVERYLRDGSLGFDQAEELGRLMDVEGTLEEGDDWETWGRFLPVRDLRAKVRRRLEEAKQASKALIPFSTHLTRQALDDYARARTLACRKAKRNLSRGETVAAVLRDYLERHDPLETKAGKRRIGDTAASDCRTVPAEVHRACLRAYGDRCWVPGCPHEIFLQRMHRQAKRHGGSQEIENIDLGCHTHHVLYDAGRMWILGGNARGLPIFETEDGWILHPDFPGKPLRKSVDASDAGSTTEAGDGAGEDRPRLPAQPDRRRPPPADRVGEPGPVWNGRPASRAAWGGAALTGASLAGDSLIGAPLIGASLIGESLTGESVARARHRPPGRLRERLGERSRAPPG